MNASANNASAILRAVRGFIREPYAWPGGYPRILTMVDGEALCAKCARSEYALISESTRAGIADGWQAAGVDVNWETPEVCAHCSAEIPAAYDDDDTGESE